MSNKGEQMKFRKPVGCELEMTSFSFRLSLILAALFNKKKNLFYFTSRKFELGEDLIKRILKSRKEK